MPFTASSISALNIFFKKLGKRSMPKPLNRDDIFTSSLKAISMIRELLHLISKSVDTGWMLNGMTIFIMPCTAFLPKSLPVITKILGNSKTWQLAMKDRFVYAGRYSSFRRRRHGNSSKHCSPSQFVVYAQNHDQIGNRAMGDRHSSIVPFDMLKISNALVLLSPYLPLLFMGEEYGETTPFLYFIDHSDPNLIEAVRQGRKREYCYF